MGRPADITTQAALDALTSTHKYVLLHIWAEWANPETTPLFAALAQMDAIPEVLAFANADVDKAPELADKFQAHTLPALFVFVDGGSEKRVEVPHDDGGDKEVVKSILGVDPGQLGILVAVVGQLAREENAARGKR